ncbi:3-deoxy-manno-octulosonate cytidylyltransferase [Psychromonas algicola]|uniref:3-deoxy-manno-octulosonate cytidylyltransferase n=1 Tax=Psychromonas algicola TaxID=2555642 RepID=UPI001067A0EB|nr:3-deoxy-manno-octulosonate cytidylyltransferase [Psychromonas sp. RZ5]TEW52312.1 3-deoxy-manno-octulosonate cytidylyltransferase [Psychromonas sp. RZ5]
MNYILLTNQIHIVIPARFGSSRLPGKPLRDIVGHPMIWHVYQRALEAGFSSIVVATDDERIAEVVKGFGGDVAMTSVNHSSGTERLAEVAEKSGWADDDIVVNLQGDEPLIDSQLISDVADLLKNSSGAGLATLVTPIKTFADFTNPNVVKAVLSHSNEALYFSRAPIPWPRDEFAAGSEILPETDVYRHIGMYAYRVDTLKRIPTLSASPLEQLESLEQLRPLQHGITIQCGIIASAPAHGVDTEEDLARVIDIIKQA